MGRGHRCAARLVTSYHSRMAPARLSRRARSGLPHGLPDRLHGRGEGSHGCLPRHYRLTSADAAARRTSSGVPRVPLPWTTWTGTPAASGWASSSRADRPGLPGGCERKGQGEDARGSRGYRWCGRRPGPRRCGPDRRAGLARGRAGAGSAQPATRAATPRRDWRAGRDLPPSDEPGLLDQDHRPAELDGDLAGRRPGRPW